MASQSPGQMWIPYSFLSISLMGFVTHSTLPHFWPCLVSSLDGKLLEGSTFLAFERSFRSAPLKCLCKSHQNASMVSGWRTDNGTGMWHWKQWGGTYRDSVCQQHPAPSCTLQSSPPWWSQMWGCLAQSSGMSGGEEIMGGGYTKQRAERWHQKTPCWVRLPKGSSWDRGNGGSAGRRPPGTPEYAKPGWEEEHNFDSQVKVRWVKVMQNSHWTQSRLLSILAAKVFSKIKQ